MKRSFFVLMFCVMVAFLLTTVTVFSQVNLNNQSNTNWRIYNVKPATSSFWDINKAADTSSGGLQFPIQPFLTDFLTNKAASFVVYLLANDNKDITGKAFSTTAFWTPGVYDTRSTSHEAFVRFEFQDVTAGPYDMNDYWWSTGSNSLDLNAGSSGTLTVSLASPALWSNLCGKSATDTTVYSGPDCLGGSYPAVSPSDGFTHAMKNVKQAGLAFGNSSRYASGVALEGGTGTFTVISFTIN